MCWTIWYRVACGVCGDINCVNPKFTYFNSCVSSCILLNGTIYFYLVNSRIKFGFGVNAVNGTVNFAICLDDFLIFVSFFSFFSSLLIEDAKQCHPWTTYDSSKSAETRAAKATKTSPLHQHQWHNYNAMNLTIFS